MIRLSGPEESGKGRSDTDLAFVADVGGVDYGRWHPEGVFGWPPCGRLIGGG